MRRLFLLRGGVSARVEPSIGDQCPIRRIMKSPPPCRLFVVVAREAPVAVILRRGPSKWVQLIRWDMNNDRFEDGAWFHGRIYEHNCGLSPDGQLFVYHAAKQQRLARDFWVSIPEDARELYGYCGPRSAGLPGSMPWRSGRATQARTAAEAVSTASANSPCLRTRPCSTIQVTRLMDCTSRRPFHHARAPSRRPLQAPTGPVMITTAL